MFANFDGASRPLWRRRPNVPLDDLQSSDPAVVRFGETRFRSVAERQALVAPCQSRCICRPPHVSSLNDMHSCLSRVVIFHRESESVRGPSRIGHMNCAARCAAKRSMGAQPYNHFNSVVLDRDFPKTQSSRNEKSFVTTRLRSGTALRSSWSLLNIRSIVSMCCVTPSRIGRSLQPIHASERAQ